MKKTTKIIAMASCAVLLAGCRTEASRVSYNLSQEADNFNDIRQITVINCLQGDVLFQMTGKMSITADVADNQLEVVVEDENGEYKKHFIGLSDNVTYVVEDITAGAQGKGAPGYRREVRVRVPAAPLQMRSCKDVQPVNHKIPQRRDSVDIEKIIKVALELLAEQEGVEITYTLTRKDKLDEPAEAQEATA